MLVILGSGEFWADEEKQPATESDLTKSLVAPTNFLRAYDRFGAHGIYVSPQAQTWLGNYATGLEPNYILINKTPVTRITSLAGGNIALVFLPPTTKNSSNEMSAEYKAALNAGRAAAQSAALVIAISPWGSELERTFAAKAEGIFHIILGGGSGYGFPASALGNTEAVLWARPENQGRAVNVIEILAWPAPAAHKWERGLNYEAYSQLLGSNIAPDPAILEIFPDQK